MKLTVGFGYRARHGKNGCATAIADYIASKDSLARVHGYTNRMPKVKILAFADALKKEVAEAIEKAGSVEKLLERGFYSDHKYFSFPSWVTADPNPDMSDPLLPMGKHSKILQWWGTDFRRNQFDQNYWIQEVEKQTVDGINLITDVRFPNEVQFIKGKGGYTVCVTRLKENGTLYVDPSRASDHISEVALEGDYNWDFFIKVRDGDQALKDEYAVTLAEYLMGRAKNG